MILVPFKMATPSSQPVNIAFFSMEAMVAGLSRANTAAFGTELVGFIVKLGHIFCTRRGWSCWMPRIVSRFVSIPAERWMYFRSRSKVAENK